MFKKLLSLVLIATMTLSMTITSFAAEVNANIVIDEKSAEIEAAYQNIMNYSVYDYETKTWNLDYSIVEDRVFTKQQYNEAEKAGKMWMEVENKYELSNEGKQRALPALLILAIKAAGAIVGAVIVEQITQHFLTWGISSGCKKFKKYAPIKSFCTANGYL